MKGRVTTETPTRDTERSGLLSIAFGVLALVGLGWTWVLSVSEVVDPPNWIRIPGILLLPAGLIAAVAFGLQARQGTGRERGLVGLVLAAASVLVFVVLLTVVG